jgi:hypothetical protein
MKVSRIFDVSIQLETEEEELRGAFTNKLLQFVKDTSVKQLDEIIVR